jgi:diguanylate cyclase (GGDEF)-like protein
MRLPFVVQEGEVRPLERALEMALPAERAAARLALAWQLRQRDSRRALALLDAGAEDLAAAPPEARPALALRELLVRGEAHWLFAERDAAERHAREALQAAQALSDPAAEADAHWLLATVRYERGDIATRDAELLAATACAERANDALRLGIIQGARARWAALHDSRSGAATWEPLFPEDGQAPAGVATWAHDFHATLSFARGDFAKVALHGVQAQDDAIATGQLNRAILVMTNVGAAFANLNDYETSLEWNERALALARQHGWPAMIVTALLQCVPVHMHLGRHDAAFELVHEARNSPGAPPGSRLYAMLLHYLCDLHVQRKEHDQVLTVGGEMEALSRQLHMNDMVVDAQRMQSYALAALGRPEEALRTLEHALDLCHEGSGGNEMEVLMALADLHARCPLPAGRAAVAATPTLYYLGTALKTALGMAGYQVPARLYESLAREHARVGDSAEAYRMMVKAGEAREQTNSAAAVNRSVALQISHQTERARSEAEHHRQLAATLQETTHTLERLSAIGQEITRHLDAASVFHTLDSHVNGLLEATHFSVYLVDEAAGELQRAYGVEDGKPMPAARLSIDNPSSMAARCARERIEIVRQQAPEGFNPSHIPGTLRSSSVMFAPLIVGDRLLGVMTIQSTRDAAYGERERLIFRTLCAYGAIALDNARAYRRLEATLTELRDAQAELVEKNRLLEEAYRQQEEASLTDPLTHLRNRRFLVQHIDAEVSLTLRRRRQRKRPPPSQLATGRPHDIDLAFFMIDVDHFKAVNDQHGHAVGDLVLVQVAERLRQVARDSDYLIRWGGEEFLLVARATDGAEATIIAERIRAAIAERGFDIGQGPALRATCSVGFACFPFFQGDTKAVSWAQTVEMADQALYTAKTEGRDRWVGWYAGDAPASADTLPRILRWPAEAESRGELKRVRGPQPQRAEAAA